MLWKYRTGNKRKEYSMDKKFAVGIPITAFFLTFFVFFMINYICNTGILGEKTVLKWDATGQYINWMAYLWDILKGNTNELFYSISITPGNGNALLVGWYLLSPYNLILLLYDKTTLCDAYYWIEAAKICSSSFTMAIFLIRIAERKKVAMNLLKSSLVLVCCLGYSYGGFVAGHTHELLYFDSIIILPLLADSLIVLKTHNKFWQYYLCLLYAIVTNFYFGVMMCIFSVLFYVYLSFRERFHLRNAIYYVITSFLATGTSLVVLLPIAYQIPLSKLSREETRLFSLTRWAFEFLVVLFIMGIIYGYYILLRNEKYLAIVSGVRRYVADAALISVGGLALHYLLNKLAWYGDYNQATVLFPTRFLFGVFGIEDYQPTGLMSIYAGILIISMFVVYLLDYRADSKTKLINIEAIVLCYFMMGFKHLNFVWHGFTYPAGSFYRWAFIVTFFVIMVVGEYIFDNDTFPEFYLKDFISSHCAFIFFVAGSFIILFSVHYYRKSIYSFVDRRALYASAILIVCYSVIGLIAKKKTQYCYLLIVGFCVFELVANGLISLEGFDFTTYSEYESYVDSMSKIMDSIRADNGNEEYRLESDYEKEWYYVGGYNTIFHSSSAFTKRNRDYLLLYGIGVNDENKLLGADNNFELQPELAGFLGIKYLVSSNEISNNEYDLIDTVEDENSGIRYNLYLNKMSLPMAYHASLKALEIVDSSEGLEQAVELVNDYTSRNGDTGLLQLGFSTYVTDMEFFDNEIAVFSVPFEKGWYAYIDGEKVNLEKAYGFFLAVKAPEGMHEIVIKYVPPYLKLGLGGSIISIIMFVFFLQIIERQRLKLNDE